MNQSKLTLRNIFEVQHLLPIMALLALALATSLGLASPVYTIAATVFLGLSVMTSVHHAEIIAHKIGEGLGTIVLALSVTILEVGLILTLMGKNNPESSHLARDTVFAAVMIVTNGIVAICLIMGGLRFKEQEFQVQGSKSLLVVLIALSFLIFVLPNYTTTTGGATYSNMQMIVIGSVSLMLYVLFVIFQTKTHKEYFEPAIDHNAVETTPNYPETSSAQTWHSFFSLCMSLIAVIALAKTLSPTIEKGVLALGAPKSAVGILIALIVLLPESWAAASAARANRLQTSLNLALGSGIASIALTIPVVIIYSIYNDMPLVLGLDPKNLTFMMMTFMVGIVTLGTGKSTLLQGAVHAGILTAYLLISFIP